MASIELTVAYPGREGAHSAAACDRLFPAARLIPLPTFSDVVDAVVAGQVPFGVLPIESSLVGPVTETHDLLYDSPLSIVAEAILPINHCLVGPEEIGLSDVDGRGVTVALLGHGVDRAHPFLRGRVTPGIDIVGRGDALA